MSVYIKPTPENCSLVHAQVKITMHYPVNIDIGFRCEDNYLIKDGDYYTTEHIFIIAGWYRLSSPLSKQSSIIVNYKKKLIT